MSDFEIVVLCIGWMLTCILCFILGYKIAKLEDEEE